MKRFDSLLRAAVCVGAVALGSSAVRAAGPLIVADFDTNNPTFTYGYSYQAAGTSSNTFGVVAGQGVAGTSAFQTTADFTNATGNFSGFGGGLGQIPPRSPVTTPSSKADFTYTAAFRPIGLPSTSATTGVSIEFQFYGPDGPDADTNNDQLLTLALPEQPIRNDGTFTILAGTFAAAQEQNGTFAALQSFIAGGGTIPQLQVNINFPGGNDFGRDADNAVLIDNFIITQVPEPATAGLLATAVAGLLVRRSRRCL